jgi:hypothetical protein
LLGIENLSIHDVNEHELKNCWVNQPFISHGE